MPRAQGPLDALQRPHLLLRQRARRGDEHPSRTDPIRLGDDGLPGRRAEHDALLRRDVESTGGEAGVGIAHEFGSDP